MVEHGTLSKYTSGGCRCTSCRNAAAIYQKNRRKNRPDVVAYNIKRSSEQRIKIAQHLRRLKDKPCTDCKIKYPYYVMQFDHLDGNTKEVGVSQIRSIVKMNEEVKKCELVCANCHAERTHQRRLDKCVMV